MKDIHNLVDSHDGISLGEFVKKGEIKSEELLECCIERAEKVNSEINAIAEKLYDSARKATPHEGLFSGVPTFVKDLFAPVAEARMTNGSNALGEARPGMDDNLVSRLRKTGCTFIGTSTSPEFGASYTTESTRFGPTRNPWNTKHSSGGSSGGSAALVAARVVPFAHANDGGGSIRVPASCCGLFGMKPTRGRMPSGPLTGEGWGGFGTAHAISLSVRDSAALMDLTAGMDLGAPYASPSQSMSFLDATKTPVRPLRIALVESMDPWPSSPESLAAVRHAAKLCESLGHEVTQAELPVDLYQFFDQCFDIIGTNTRNYVELLGQMRGKDVSLDELQVHTRIMLREKGNIDAVQYVRAIESMHALGRRFANLMTEYDVILTPTLAKPPVLIGTLDVIDENKSADDLIQHYHSYSPYTCLFNATGQPAMSVPLYWTEQGLPIGAHFSGRFGDEETLFSLAAQLEQAQPWFNNRPKVNACS
ncbi:MAG: amidase [Oceanospirillaceae bacterium]|nr:amidase [Oceanospirillaceae bacterium]